MIGLCALSFVGCSGKEKARVTQDSSEVESSVAASSAEEGKYEVVDGKIHSTSSRPLVVDFYADWCPPCQQMKPVFAALAEKYNGKVDFVSINVDEERELAAAYGVESIPYFVFIAPDGKEVGHIVGSTPESNFSTALESYFALK